MIIGQQQISCSSAITLTQGEDDAVAGGHRSDNDLGMETKVAAWLLIDYLKGARALILRQILHRLIRRSARGKQTKERTDRQTVESLAKSDH
ncbi:uncharacterized protein LOC100679373 isoform X4 [Nasonia vitripennis]|uniref:Uncharacterized protein n=1 Tax=Nasonia vitripennis TaxID=7425 RepID=A0A7M7QCU3_NASVI|nr:uncharacterized protein LOC100679373 isoform X4 [Nasonia vitripennis]